MRFDYCEGLYFKNAQELFKAKELLEKNGFDVDNVTSYRAISIEEAIFKLEESDSIYSKETNEKVDITDHIVYDLAEYLYEEEYIDSYVIGDSFNDWLEDKEYHL